MLFQRTFPPNFAHKGPKARGKKNHRSCLCPPGGQNQSFWRASPVMGAWGQMTVSARSAKALTGINPQRFFGSFLIAQKGTSPLLAPQGGTLQTQKASPQELTLRGRLLYQRKNYTSFTTPTNRVTPWLRSTNRKGRFRFITQVSSGGAPVPGARMVTAAASTPSSSTLTRVICWAWFR